jgi:hypothetical protein
MGMMRTDQGPPRWGLPPEHRRIDGQLDLEYFPVVLVGHGIAAVPTFVFTDARTPSRSSSSTWTRTTSSAA